MLDHPDSQYLLADLLLVFVRRRSWFKFVKLFTVGANADKPEVDLVNSMNWKWMIMLSAVKCLDSVRQWPFLY